MNNRLCLSFALFLGCCFQRNSFAAAAGTISAVGANGSNASEDIAQWSLDEKLGQLFMVGFKSEEQLLSLKPGGVVLFSWNMKNVAQVRALTARLKRLSARNFKRPLFVAIDHEGGQVLRLRRGLTNFPDAAAVGATHDPFIAFRVGKAMGQELSALGVNMNLAPVLDLGNARSFLQNRIWGDKGRPVGEMTTAFIRGLSSARVLSVAKHFPGHGRSTIDSHHGLPTLNVSESQLWSEDLEPFREAAQEGVQAVMTAHVSIPVVDTLPASLSHKFITGMLREKIGFQGLVVTDDLEMGGVSSWGNSGEVALKALQAGSDMLLVAWTEKAQVEILDRLKKAVASGELPVALIDERVRRILRIKSEFLNADPSMDRNPFWKENLRRSDSLELTEVISKKAVSWQGGDFDNTMQALARDWRGSWSILLPSEGLRSEWHSFRPGDSVEVIPRNPGAKALGELERRLNSLILGKGTLLVVTGPRAGSSEEVFQLVRKGLSLRQESQQALSTVVWAHQGSRPVEIHRDPASLRVGLVSLYTSSKRGISAFVNLVREGTAKFLPLQSSR